MGREMKVRGGCAQAWMALERDRGIFCLIGGDELRTPGLTFTLSCASGRAVQLMTIHLKTAPFTSDYDAAIGR
jgi:hypothetical protein